MKLIKCINETMYETADGTVIEFTVQQKRCRTEPDKTGFVFDAEYPSKVSVDGIRYFHPIRRKWVDMKTRCYSEKYQASKPTYVGCSIYPEWKTYSSFAAWMMEQYDWLNRAIDKDILVPGNKVYGPDFCRMVPSQVNNLLTDSKAARGDSPLGVSVYSNGCVRARCWYPGGEQRSKSFGYGGPNDGQAIRSAHQWWQLTKAEAIGAAVSMYLDEDHELDVIIALMARRDQLLNDALHGRETLKL